METPWTPGPWQVVSDGDDWVISASSNEVVRVNEGFAKRGLQGRWNGDIARVDGGTEADARLMEAAPKMAALLEDAARIEDEGWDLALSVGTKAAALLARVRNVPAPAWQNVRDHGAQGDWSHDDAPAIQETVDAVSASAHEHEWKRLLPEGRVTPGPGTFIIRTTLLFSRPFEWCPLCNEVRNVPAPASPQERT